MTRRYTVGGVAFVSDEHLEGLETDGFTDVELRTWFTDDAIAPMCDKPGAFLVSGPMDTTGTIAPDTFECWLPAAAGPSAARAWQLRQIAPVFSAMLDRLVLHASAVEIDGSVVGFIGESGAGKSTLARYLAKQDYRLAADDLLPVRFAPQATCPIGTRMAPLGALFLLKRGSDRTVHLDRLPRMEVLRGLIANGFGEHGNETAWAFQFDAYHRLAESLPAFDMTIPNDLGALPLVGKALESLLADRDTAQSFEATE